MVRSGRSGKKQKRAEAESEGPGVKQARVEKNPSPPENEERDEDEHLDETESEEDSEEWASRQGEQGGSDSEGSEEEESEPERSEKEGSDQEDSDRGESELQWSDEQECSRESKSLSKSSSSTTRKPRPAEARQSTATTTAPATTSQQPPITDHFPKAAAGVRAQPESSPSTPSSSSSPSPSASASRKRKDETNLAATHFTDVKTRNFYTVLGGKLAKSVWDVSRNCSPFVSKALFKTVALTSFHSLYNRQVPSWDTVLNGGVAGVEFLKFTYRLFRNTRISTMQTMGRRLMKSFQVGDKPKSPRGKNKVAVIPASPAGSWAATTGADVLSRLANPRVPDDWAAWEYYVRDSYNLGWSNPYHEAITDAMETFCLVTAVNYIKGLRVDEHLLQDEVAATAFLNIRSAISLVTFDTSLPESGPSAAWSDLAHHLHASKSAAEVQDICATLEARGGVPRTRADVVKASQAQAALRKRKADEASGTVKPASWASITEAQAAEEFVRAAAGRM